MREYLRSRLVKIGLGLLILGTGPLLFIIIAAAIGLWPDPDPNPIGPGFLAFLTFWPGVICLGVGIYRVRREKNSYQPLQKGE
jgi:hypothetical protein